MCLGWIRSSRNNSCYDLYEKKDRDKSAYDGNNEQASDYTVDISKLLQTLFEFSHFYGDIGHLLYFLQTWKNIAGKSIIPFSSILDFFNLKDA